MKYTRQKYEEQKTEELKNKSTTDHKNSINSKETYKTNHNMASKNFPVIDSHVISWIGFHVNKLAPENDTSESKYHVLLPFLYENEDLTKQAAVSATTTTTKINSRNNANTNNKTVNHTNSILIPSSTTTTATNNRTNNENTNNKTVNDSNKPLKPTSTSATATINNTNSANTNNSENNSSSKLTSSRIDKV